MVIHCRVDERLLHGQVAVTWMSQVSPDSILIANDDVVNNEVSKMALKMVKPEGTNMAIRSVDDGAAVLNDPRAQGLKIFVIVRTVQDLVRLMKQTDQIHSVNIGGIRKKDGSKLIAASVYLNDDDAAALKQLKELCDDVYFQMVPADSRKSVDEVLRIYEKQ